MTVEQDYIEQHPTSRQMYDRAKGSLPSGVTHDGRFMRPFPIYADRAQGSRKWDVDGNELVDFVMGHGALLLGHNYASVQEAAMKQLEKGTHYGAGHELELQWAEEVINLVPSAEEVRFTSSGTEATLMALRLARAFSGKPATLKFDRHFHGWHDYVIGGSHYSDAIPPGVPPGTLDSVAVIAPEMHVVRETVASRPDIGSVIVEASGAGSGGQPLDEGFLKELRRFTEEQGLLMVMDEVVTGFRWSEGGVQQLEGIKPDLTALAKILAGGLPGGAVAGRRELLERLHVGTKNGKVGHPGTFNANPLSASAGVACLKEVADGSHQKRAVETSRAIIAGMNTELRGLGIPGYAYGQSSVFRLAFGGDDLPEARHYDGLDVPAQLRSAGIPANVFASLNHAMSNHGVHLFGNGGIVSSVHTSEDIDRTLDAWSHSLKELKADGIFA